MILKFSAFSSFAARAELDGNRPRAPNPLTIIQVKNPEKNLDSNEDGRGSTAASARSSAASGAASGFLFFGLSMSRRICFLGSLLACAVFVAGFIWAVPCGGGSSGLPTCR